MPSEELEALQRIEQLLQREVLLLEQIAERLMPTAYLAPVGIKVVAAPGD